MQIVLSLDEATEKELRRLAKEKYDGRKGALSEIVRRGVKLVSEEEKRAWAHGRLLEIAKNAKDAGVGKFRREDAYGRKIFG